MPTDDDWTLESHPVVSELMRPLLPYIKDSRVTELSINGFGEIFIEAVGKGYRAERAPWCTAGWAWSLCIGIANVAGHRFPQGKDDDTAKPLLSLVLPGRHRFHAILGREVPSGIVLSIRMYRVRPDLNFSSFGMDDRLADRVRGAIKDGATVLLSGGVGSGKSSLLRLLAREIPMHERVGVVGDLDELDLPHPNQFRLMLNRFSRNGDAALDFGDMIDSILRLNGSVTVINELSVDNAVPAWRLLNTGLTGSFLTTLHSNSPLDALEAWRRNVAFREGPRGSGEVVRFLARSVDVIIHCARRGVDARKVTGVVFKDPKTNELDMPWRDLLAEN